MNRIVLIIVIVIIFTNHFIHAQTGILSSQIGYDYGDIMRVLVRNEKPDYLSSKARFKLLDSEGKAAIEGRLQKWGQKWGSYWWIVDLSGLQSKGKYTLIIEDNQVHLTGDTIEVGNSLLWSKCYRIMAFDNLKTRAEQARTGKGWRDCGSDLQEFSSHVVAVDGLCDILEIGTYMTTPDEKKLLLEQILRGSGYLVHLQDKAKSLGLGDGPVVHEDRQKDIVTGNVAKAAMILARVSRIIRTTNEQISVDYLERAKRAFVWIEKMAPL
jgi:hypothetical protein